jgi:UDP-3-O-[3-hydroxymyristoyl] glucosamine N-acyltransferase
MNKRLIIYGAGAHAQKVYRCSVLCGYSVDVFVVDQLQDTPSEIDGIAIMHINDCKFIDTPFQFTVAIGHSESRMQKYKYLSNLGGKAISLVHPNSYVSDTATIEAGSVILAGAIVEESSKIGFGTIVDVGCIVDHDCRIGQFSHLKPGSVLVSYTELADFSTIDAGSVVRTSLNKL